MLSGSSVNVTPVGAAMSESRTDWPISRRADVDADEVDEVGRERLDVHLVDGLVERAAHVHALGVALEVDRDHGLDLLVEPDLVKVDVDDPAAHRVELEILDQHRPALAVAVERDVEDRVQTAPPPPGAARAR